MFSVGGGFMFRFIVFDPEKSVKLRVVNIVGC